MNLLYLTREELHEVLRRARKLDYRHWLMILVAYHHGLRASEVCGLQSSDIVDGFLTVQRLKGSKKTVQPLPVCGDPLLDEKEALELWASTVSGPLWPMQGKNFWKIFRRYCELAGIPRHKSSTKVLKHSIAMHSIKAAGIHSVQRHLGHRNITSTAWYLVQQDEEASRAVAIAAGW